MPPRRESIEEHLATARVRVKIPGEGWTDKLASARFVLDLIERKIINGPVEIDKAAGPGRGRRFLPGDYHDLLELIRFKALGAHRRDAWIVRLWLHGHDYPVDKVKEALIREVGSALDAAQTDFAPTRRWTEPFSVKYDRRVRQRSEGALYPELTDPMEPIAAYMMRPDLLGQTNPSADTMTALLADATGRSEEELRPLVDSVIEATKNNTSVTAEASAKILEIAQAQLPSAFLSDLSKPNSVVRSELGQLSERLHGLYGDGSTEARMLRMLEAAPQEHFERARKLARAVLSGQLEHLIANLPPEAPPDFLPFIEYLQSDARRNRLMRRHNPWVMMNTFATWVVSYVPPNTASDTRHRADADEALLYLKELVDRGHLSFQDRDR